VVVIADSTASVAATVVLVLLMIRQLSTRARRVDIVTRDVSAGRRARRKENKD
jgi:hypothetical protein